jgi:hypothetical protein
MSERREKLEYLIKEYLDLDKHLYIGHDIQLDVYDKRTAKVKELEVIVKPRIDAILGFFKSLPEGRWRTSKYFCTWQYFCRRDSKNYKVEWIAEDKIGCEFYDGEDDGYPNRECFTIENELLLVDDEQEVKRMILKRARQDCDAEVLELEFLLGKEQCYQKRLEAMELMAAPWNG